MKNLELNEVWLSSIEHIEKFNEITRKNKWWKNLLGLQKIDPNFPQVSLFGQKFPITLYSFGKAELNNQKLTYVARIKLDPKYQNLQNDLKLELPFHKIKEFSLYKNPNPYMEKFNYPWVSILMDDGQQYLISHEKEIGNIDEGLKNTEAIYNWLRIKIT